MKFVRRNEGFTLVELLLVAVIMGLMLAVVVPRAWRANIDTKYSIVRQNCTELASYGMQWAETELAGQHETLSDATLSDYLAYLCGETEGNFGGAEWVAKQDGPPSWLDSSGTVEGRVVDGGNNSLGGNAASFVPTDRMIKNPFNGVSVFHSSNDPRHVDNPVPGAILNAFIAESVKEWKYFAFTFQGTENTGRKGSDMHGNMNAETLEGLRNGVFFARVMDNS